MLAHSWASFLDSLLQSLLFVRTVLQLSRQLVQSVLKHQLDLRVQRLASQLVGDEVAAEWHDPIRFSGVVSSVEMIALVSREQQEPLALTGPMLRNHPCHSRFGVALEDGQDFNVRPNH